MRLLRKLRILGLIEGVTLLTLLCVAVPLKHVAGISEAVSVIGPIHGIAFLVYIRFLIVVAAESGWKQRDIIRTAAVSFIPLGTFYNDRYLKQMEQNGGQVL